MFPSLLIAYKTSSHSSTGIKPFFLIFGGEAQVQCEIISGRSGFEDPRRPASFACKLIRKLESAFDFLKGTLHAAQKGKNESFELGVNQVIFKPFDMVSIKIIINHAEYASKLQSPWSTPHDMIASKGVVVTLRTISNKSVVKVHAHLL